ncbi:hypothetical protein FLK61_26180 [Paenalkalicoccus suaedae]|uniref:Uncharacterized protein n=1 Tax=Paenalkalicoccus suaedae TaxID=2592382 RepID=A0A859FBY7_9BACI|nr:hypothetical protein [Paenalkalicoccus suaedae]QKS70251.1 hypothetical protein FLK61_26180 [Paenalkalicoccus suaedae]
MNFKDMVNDDIFTFLNIDEFGEVTTIDDEEVVVVFGTIELSDFTIKNGEGLLEEDRIFYVKDGDLSFYPRQGNKIVVNGDKCEVLQTSEDDGLLKVLIRLIES